MPIFGYQCEKCGMEYELLETCKGDGDAPKCPHCGADKPLTHQYRICRYWQQMLAGAKGQHIRPGSWA